MNCKAREKFGLKINTIKAFEVINGGTRLLFYQKCVFVTNGEVGWGCVWRDCVACYKVRLEVFVLFILYLG